MFEFLKVWGRGIFKEAPSLPGACADAAMWQFMADEFSQSLPDSGGVGNKLGRGVLAGFFGGAADGLVSFITNIIYAKLCEENGVRLADVSKKTIFQWVQSTVNGMLWQGFASAGEALGALAGRALGSLAWGAAVGGGTACLLGIFFTTWLSNKIYDCLRPQAGGSGVSAASTGGAALGFYVDGPTTWFSAENNRDVAGAAILSVSGAAALGITKAFVTAVVELFFKSHGGAFSLGAKQDEADESARLVARV